jgi:hypothetical protein
MAHTPGPWRVDVPFGIPTVIAPYFPKGATCVAVVYGDNKALMARVPGGNDADVVANAHLIAAAPELLWALKLVVTCFPTAIAVLREEDRARLTAAIEKAEGK